jgi:transposase
MNCPKKKHRQFVCVIIDNSNKRVLDILECRDKGSLIKYLQQKKGGGLLAEVEEVTCDMWEGYANAATDVFGTGIRVTIDRFHVMKNFQEQLTEARREIQRRLGKEEAKALKGTRWLWVKNWDNLTAQEQQELEELKKRFPELKQLAEQRESLRAIFEDRTITTAAEGAKRFQAWMEQARKLGLKGLDAFCKTLTSWLEKIANYFVTRSSNGRTEGFNHALRSILWRAFGMTNFAHFRLRALHRFGRPANA